ADLLCRLPRTRALLSARRATGRLRRRRKRRDARPHLIEPPDALLQHGDALVAGGAEDGGRLLRALQGLRERAVQLFGERAEVIASGALHQTQTVLELLADLKGHLVDVPAHDRLGLLLAPAQAVAHVLAVRAAPHQHA